MNELCANDGVIGTIETIAERCMQPCVQATRFSSPAMAAAQRMRAF